MPAVGSPPVVAGGRGGTFARMRHPVIALVAVLAVAAAGGATFALVERHNRGGLVARSEQSCNGRDQPQAGVSAALPLALPGTAGSRLLSVAQQGRTVVAYTTMPGGRDDIVAVRDRVLADLEGAGYRVAGTDQEPGYEAEAELAGLHEGTVKVSPLCTGLLEVRYKIDS